MTVDSEARLGMAAESVSADLRASVRGARAMDVRCLRAGVADAPPPAEPPGDGGRGELGGREPQRTLVLAQACPGLPGASLEQEFHRCVFEVVPKQPPCLLLFRTDQRENVEGCRWLLVVWLPSAAPQAERAACVRSRGLLARLVPQPHFLRELFASGLRELNWRAVCEACAGGVKDAAAAPAPRARPPRPPPDGAAAAAGPIQQAPALAGLLERLARREDPCVRLVLVAPSRAGQGGQPAPPTLEAKVCDSRSPAHLAKAGLPSSASYFAMYVRDDLAFIHWCPETMTSKDAARVHDDARYAILKTAVLGAVLAALPRPPARVLRVSAREPQEIVEGVTRAVATEGAAPALPQRLAGRSPEAERGWPSPGGVADWPDHWPSAAFPAAMPSSLVLPQRPVPPWRGGARSGTIGAMATASSSGSHRSKVTRLGTTHFGDLR